MRIGIIGGGLAGLVCARRLTQAGLRPVLLEKEPHLGGRTRTEIIDGIPVDLGAKTFSKSYRHFRELVDALGLKQQIKRVPMLQEALYINGQVISLSNLLSGDLFSPQELLQIAKLSIGGGRGDITWPPGDAFEAIHHLSWRDKLTAEGYGAKVFENLLDPLARLVTHEDSTHISAAFGNFLASLMNTPKFVLSSGFQVVVDALEAQLRPSADVLTSTEVQAIVPRQPGYVLKCSNADGASEVAVDIVVAALPIPILNRLLPELPVACSYATSLHIVVRGRRKPVFGDCYFLATVANEHGIVSCIGNQEIVTVLAKNPSYSLDFLFDEYEVIQQVPYEHSIALMTPGCKVPALEPGPDRFFLCGDFYYYPSVEAAVVSGQTVAQRIVERHG